MIDQVFIKGLPVNLGTRKDFIERLTSWIVAGDRPRQVVTLNALMLNNAVSDPELGRVIRQADLVTADGYGVVLALRRLGYQTPRVTGVALIEELLSWCSEQGTGVFFYGGTRRITYRLEQAVQDRWPGLVVKGIWDGFGDASCQEQVRLEIKRSKPALLLAGLGSPRQERFIADILREMNGIVGIGVGGAFEIIAGTKSSAPKFLAEHGWEWCFRMLQEPRRIRFLPQLVQFYLRFLL